MQIPEFNIKQIEADDEGSSLGGLGTYISSNEGGLGGLGTYISSNEKVNNMDLEDKAFTCVFMIYTFVLFIAAIASVVGLIETIHLMVKYW